MKNIVYFLREINLKLKIPIPVYINKIILLLLLMTTLFYSIQNNTYSCSKDMITENLVIRIIQ